MGVGIIRDKEIRMDWINGLNAAIAYIEGHLEEDLNLKEASRIAGCSAYHFQRMFGYMAGVPLSEYIRRRKMSLAVSALMAGERVIDVALDCGYDSPTAFNRAFKKIHGVAPSKIGEVGVSIKAYPPIHFQITIKGEQAMDYRIVKKDAFKIIGVSMPLDQEIEKNFEAVPGMWDRAAADGTIFALASLMNTEIHGLLGVSACNDAEAWTYYIAVASTLDTPPSFEAYEVPAATWAVFPGAGAGTAIQELEMRIVREWLPTSGYEYGDAPDIEVYLNPDPENATFEVWIPIREK